MITAMKEWTRGRIVALVVILGSGCGASTDDAKTGGSMSATSDGGTGVASSGSSGSSSEGSSATEGSTDGGSSGSTGTGSTTGPVGCYSQSADGDCGLLVPGRPRKFNGYPGPWFECGMPAVCASVFLTDAGDPGFPPSPTQADVPAMRCILTAMRDRVPATHRFGESTNGGQFVTSRAVEMLSNGLVIWRTNRIEDLVCRWEESQRTPPEPAYFEECLATEDPDTLWSCLSGMLGASECAEAAAVCP